MQDKYTNYTIEAQDEVKNILTGLGIFDDLIISEIEKNSIISTEKLIKFMDENKRPPQSFIEDEELLSKFHTNMVAKKRSGKNYFLSVHQLIVNADLEDLFNKHLIVDPNRYIVYVAQEISNFFKVNKRLPSEDSESLEEVGLAKSASKISRMFKPSRYYNGQKLTKVEKTT